MNESKERLYFVDEILTALTNDHNARHSVGQETNRFNRKDFESEVYRNYPEVVTSELLNTARKAVSALKKDPGLNRGMDEKKVDGLMKYIFTNSDASKWPTVVNIVKSFAGGKFAHYAKNAASEDERNIAALEKMLVGSSNYKDPHLQAMNLFVELSIKSYKENREQMDSYKSELDNLRKREKDLKKAVKALHDKLSALDTLTSEEKKILEEIKTLLK